MYDADVERSFGRMTGYFLPSSKTEKKPMKKNKRGCRQLGREGGFAFNDDKVVLAAVVKRANVLLM